MKYSRFICFWEDIHIFIFIILSTFTFWVMSIHCSISLQCNYCDRSTPAHLQCLISQTSSSVPKKIIRQTVLNVDIYDYSASLHEILDIYSSNVGL